MKAHDIGQARDWLTDSTDPDHEDDARAASTISEALDLACSVWFTCWLCLELVPEEATSRSGLCSTCAGDKFEARPSLADAVTVVLHLLNAQNSADIENATAEAANWLGVRGCVECGYFRTDDEYDSRSGWCHACADADD